MTSKVNTKVNYCFHEQTIIDADSVNSAMDYLWLWSRLASVLNYGF